MAIESVSDITFGGASAFKAEPTAQEILTALKDVDGASSGLDADLLDGQEGSYYLNAGNLTGTVPTARLPAFTGDIVTSGASATLNLPVVNDDVGTYGNSLETPVITVDSKGRITSVSTAPISGGGGESSSLVWTATAIGTGASQSVTIPSAEIASNLLVFVNGIYQQPTTYSTSSTVLTITAPPGSNITIIKPGNVAVGSTEGTPPSGGSGGRSFVGPGAYRYKVPWLRRIGSDWRIPSIANAAATTGTLRALPFSVYGKSVVALDFLLQTASTGTLFFGIYAVEEVTGMPGELLWSTTWAAGGEGTGAKTISLPAAITDHDMLWVASYCTGTVTTVIGASASQAERDIGFTSLQSMSSPIVSVINDGTFTWSGSMPATFPYNTTAPLSPIGNVPLTYLRLAADA